MSTLAPPVNSATKDLVKKADVNSPFWKIAILVGINLLTVPVGAILFYPLFPLSQSTRYLLSFVLFGIYHGHLFLLAYWMTFGGVPKRGRFFLASLLAVVGAIPIGIMTAHQNAVAHQQDNLFFGWEELPLLLPLVCSPPLIALIIVWLLHAVFMVPQRISQIVITFSELKSTTPIPARRVTPEQIFIWIVICAIPIALYMVLQFVDQIRTDRASPHILTSTLFGLVALTPAAMLLVTETHFVWKLIAAMTWAVVVMILFMLIPNQWTSADTISLHVAFCVTVILNLIILRALGLRWLPTTAKPPTAAAK